MDAKRTSPSSAIQVPETLNRSNLAPDAKPIQTYIDIFMNKFLTLLSCCFMAAAFFLYSVQGAAAPQAAQRIEIAEVAPISVPAGMPVIKYVAGNDAAWKEGPPSFTIADGTTMKAQGWLAVTQDAILMKVIVSDKTHINTQEKSRIWDGDCLQIGVDAEGNAVGSQASGTRVVGPHVGAAAVALTARGPEIWMHFLGTNGQDGLVDGARHFPCSVVRDETAKTTTYEIAFPWEEYSTQLGQSPFIGLSIQVNDTEKNTKPVRYYWGHGADGLPAPGLFIKMAVEVPSTVNLIAIETEKTKIRTRSASGEMKLAIQNDKDLEIVAKMDKTEKKLKIGKSDGKAGIRRFVVRGTPGFLPTSPVQLSVQVKDTAGKVEAEQKAQLIAAGTIVGTLHEKLDSLIASSPHPLFTKHLRALDTLVQAEWNRALFLTDASPFVADAVEADCQVLLDSLNSEGGDWSTYLRGEKPLVFLRSAGPDSTLQSFRLTLPRNWDPAKTYPIIVDLHGRGSELPLAYPVGGMKSKMCDDASWKNNDQQYFRLLPWGRGNTFYRESGEDDVYETLDIVRQEFTIDRDRTYLTGHSMGGGGAWKLGLRTPDVWAAVCPVSGGIWGTPLSAGLGANAAQVPFRIRHGDADAVVNVRHSYDMQTELRAGGSEPEVIIMPGEGHGYPDAAKQDDTNWLLQHTRKRPDQFSYTAEAIRRPETGRGAWGILFTRAPIISGLPHFDCTIKGSEVRITSSNTKGLTVRLGKDGLGMQGPVQVWWNGRKSYEGPAREINLGEPED